MSALPLIRIEDPSDPRIDGYRDVRDRDLTGRSDLFMAEGEVVLRVLASAAGRCEVESVLLAENRPGGLRDVIDGLPAETPVYVAPQAVLDQIAGFHLHRGILAMGRKPAPLDLERVLSGLPAKAMVVLVCGVGNHDNIGGIFRNAAALGAAAVLLDRHCADPFYRKAIRVSVGAVLRTPMIRNLSAVDAVASLQAAGFSVLALTPGAARSLATVELKNRVAVVLGSEGPGLPSSLIDRCSAAAIPMAGGFDSLNVATAGAVALERIRERLGLAG
ncbi:MAG: RNA methyltransferase [Brevundimonas sp.]|nr:MAG: RNA methyltransferase [Brevundimonas sp.]